MTDAADIAARTAWGEARGDGLRGMQAVLNTVANRVAQPGWWGRDIASVCQAPWQYSCWIETDPNRAKLLAVTDEDPIFRQAQSLAAKLVAGTLEDITGGCDSYFAIGTRRPLWANGRSYRTIIGNQEFFRVGLNGDGK